MTELGELNQLDLTLEGDGSAYRIGGKRLNRVTEIVGAVFPPYLVPWAEKIGAEAMYRLWEENETLPGSVEQAREMIKRKGWNCDSLKTSGGDRGLATHMALERYIKDETLPDRMDYPQEVEPFISNLCDFLLDYRPVFNGSELTVYHGEQGYAGTLDACGYCDAQPTKTKIELAGKNIIFDLKTNQGGRVYFPQHHYQLAAYRLAWDWLELPKVEHEIVVAIGQNSYQVAVNYVKPEAFLPVLDTYRSLENAKDANPNRRKGK